MIATNNFGGTGVWHIRLIAVGFALLGGAVAAQAAERAMPARRANPEHETVGFFQAVENSQIEAKMIQLDSLHARLLVKNKTGQPLNIRLPDAFAARPILAQLGGGFGGGGRGGGGFGGGGGGAQTTGGGGGGFGGGGGAFNVPAERLSAVELPTVCLEHGKAEPRPAIPYEIVPLDQVTDRAEIRELLKLFAEGRFSQAAAQAAAWHLANGMSWEQLAAKRIRRANGAQYPYFSNEALQAAVRMTEVAVQRARQTEGQSATSSSSASDSYGGYPEEYRQPRRRRNRRR